MMVVNFSIVNEPTIMFCSILIAAIVLDLLMGDPRWLPHPVILMGKFITCLENRWNRGEGRVWKGIGLTTTVVVLVFTLSVLLVLAAYQVHSFVGVFMQVYLISTTIAINGLSSAAKEVLVPLVNGNLPEARVKLSMIVGRDTDRLPENEMVRGTVETVAENTVDGITAPLFWAIIGGAPLAMAYRAINTLDSMVGHKDEKYMQFGWASAKTDDLANWIPARLTALSMWLAAFLIKGSNKRNGWNITWRDAKKHPSPNSGWSEAMVAGLIGIQLGGINYYRGRKSVRAQMGDSLRELVPSDIEKAILYMHGGWIVFLLISVCFLLFVR
jgi:adenosylcobinamide-phosphate synthase